MSRFAVFTAMLLCFISVMATPAVSYDTRDAERYTREAEYYQKQAESYRREAEYYQRKAEGYQREAAYYTRKGDADRARDYSRRADRAMES